jgi:ferredoxin-nitrite reductase
MTDEFTEEQKQYLQGFAAGSNLSAKLAAVPTFASTLGVASSSTGPRPVEHACYDAQDATLARGGKLNEQEQAKRKRFPLDQWDDLVSHAKTNTPPKGTDVLAFKYFGLFWVAPAQDSFMSRLRFAGGIVPSYQLKGVADLADRYGAGHCDITTRANLQIRQIEPKNADVFLEGLYDLGIVNRGSGADNIRNITASPLAGIDPHELIDTRDLARKLNHHILNHRELFGLPRKFNIAFDGAGTISALEDTNDIGFSACVLKNDSATNTSSSSALSNATSNSSNDSASNSTIQQDSEPSKAHVTDVGAPTDSPIGFRLTLGGITGHKDFARDTGIFVAPDDCIAVSHAILLAFIEHGDRTDRKKARLKYVLDRMGFDGFLKEVEKHYGKPLTRVPLQQCVMPTNTDKQAHVGWHVQKQSGQLYAGIVVPAGRLTSDQLRGIARIADRFGSGTIRLTVWQNLIISDIAERDRDAVEAALRDLNLTTHATSIRAGLVACTGAAGCKFANAHTKTHGLQLADYLEQRVELDSPINIHLTGCPHSCAQHYIGDIGLLGTKVSVGEDMLEGYHLYIGGGYGSERNIARELQRNILATDLPRTLQRLLEGYLARRSDRETFNSFVRRHDIADLLPLIQPEEIPA